jgi:predicted dehydrogenase
MQLEFESGAIGVAETSWTQIATKESTVIYGTEGTLTLGDGGGLQVFLKTRASDGWWTPDCPETPAHAAHRHWIECILEDKQPKGTPEHGRHVVEIMLAAAESEKTGRRVSIHSRFEPVIW